MVSENRPACFCGLRASRTLIFRRPKGKVEPARSIFKVPSYKSPVLLSFVSLPSIRVMRAFVSSKPLGHPSALSYVFVHRTRALCSPRVCNFRLRTWKKYLACAIWRDISCWVFLITIPFSRHVLKYGYSSARKG